ncbi:MAG: NAD-dependent epimerase/dehydratase family protein, partial [Actinomycetales bacterium]|nr:NAD-dependent epimerase/dehydratase family protein [Actinomycetales bacterium]
MARHVVVGKGPIGTTLAQLLTEQGHKVTVVSRSGGPAGGDIEHRAADVSSPGTLTAIARGADVVYNCVNPPYHRWATDWPPLHAELLDAAEANDAVLVTTGNLYGHGAGSGVMREDTPLVSTETKGRVRAAMWHDALARHEAGRVRATEVRAADYFGPFATDAAHYGGRMLTPLFAGKTLRPVGSPDAPHAVVFVPDFARALAAAGSTPEAWGHAWLAPHLPAESFRKVASRFAAAAGVAAPRISPVPGLALRVVGWVLPVMREVERVSYQFTEPFVVDSAVSERTLGL